MIDDYLGYVNLLKLVLPKGARVGTVATFRETNPKS